MVEQFPEMTAENLKAEDPDAHLASGEESQVKPESPVKSVFEKNLSRKWFFLTVGFGVFCIASVLFLNFYSVRLLDQAAPAVSLKSLPEPVEQKGKITLVEGESFKVEGDQRLELKTGDSLTSEDLIETRENAFLVIDFKNGSVLKAGPQSTFRLQDLTSKRTALEYRQGSLYCRTSPSGDVGFMIEASNFMVESLGTVFALTSGSQGTNVSVFEGLVKVVADQKLIEVPKSYQWQEFGEENHLMTTAEIEENAFISQSLDQDFAANHIGDIKQVLLAPTPTSTPKPTVTPRLAPETSLFLEAVSKDNGVLLEWSVTGLDVTDGFKLVKSEQANPSFPQDNAVFQAPESRRYLWAIKDGKTYHFRVCLYQNGACGQYSNDVTAIAPVISTGEVKKIDLSVENVGGGTAKLRWSVEGLPAAFKVVWSRNAEPVYPPRTNDQDWAEWQSGETREKEIGGLNGTYYFRVCHYLSGCQLYSNEVSKSF